MIERLRWYLLAVGTLGLAVAVFFYWQSHRDSQIQQVLQTETPLPQQSRIVALGRLEPEGSVITIAGVTGERVARLEVKEGDWVNKGAILAYLSNYEVRRAQWQLAGSRVTELTQQLQANTMAAKIQIQQSQAQIKRIDQPQAFEIEAQTEALRRVEAELDSRSKTRDRYSYLFQEGAISRQDLDDKELLVKQAQTNVDEAKAALARLKKVYQSDLAKAEVDVNYAEANLAQIQNQITLSSARQELNLAAKQLEQMIIRAPQSGRILKIFAYPGESLAQKGLLQIGDTRTMYAVAEIYETDINKVQLGQKAMIQSPVFPKPLRGEVTEIGQYVYKNELVSDDPSARSDVRVVEVKVRLDHSELVAKLSYLRVDVEITL